MWCVVRKIYEWKLQHITHFSQSFHRIKSKKKLKKNKLKQTKQKNTSLVNDLNTTGNHWLENSSPREIFTLWIHEFELLSPRKIDICSILQSQIWGKKNYKNSHKILWQRWIKRWWRGRGEGEPFFSLVKKFAVLLEYKCFDEIVFSTLKMVPVKRRRRAKFYKCCLVQKMR